MPLLWLSLAFLLGITLSDILPFSTLTWLIFTGISLGFSLIQIGFIRRGNSLPCTPFIRKIRFYFKLPLPILLYTLCLGGIHFQGSLPDLADPGFIAYHNDTGQEMMVTGIVTNMPDERDTYTLLKVKAEWMHPSKSLAYTDIHGSILVRTNPEAEFHYGDRVLVRGYLETPSEGESFSYRNFLIRQGIYTVMKGAKVSRLESNQGVFFMDWIYTLRENALGLAYRLWPDPEASLFAGILLGVESGIPEPVENAFIETGTSHIIAISGFNIAIISGLFIKTFGRILGPYRGALVAIFAITLYTLLVGAQASVVRAAIMAGLALGGSLVGRRQSGPHALILTAAGMSIQDPHVLWDVGFQLSFAATLGLVLFAEPLSESFKRFASRWVSEERAEALSGPVGEFFLFTFAAQVTTLPIIAYHFGRISWVSFLANPVILPVQPPVMILGGISLILSLIWYPLGQILAYIAGPFVTFTIRSVEFFAKYTRGSLVFGEVSLIWVILFFTLLLGLTFNWLKIKGWVLAERERRQASLFIPLISLLGIVTMLVYRTVMSAPDGKLHLTFLEVGTGDAILVRTPGGRYLLLNGGPSASLLADGLGRRMPLFQREFDWWVVASPQQHQVAALPTMIERYPPTDVLWAGLPSASRQADYLRDALKTEGVPIHSAMTGNVLDLGNGAVLEVLAAGKRGAVLLVQWNYFRAIFPLGLSEGDLESLRMGMDIGAINLLLLAESGYAPANPSAWIASLNPGLVLLSVAPGDPDGLPDVETLAMLNGYALLRTDINGWIEVTTDGKQMWVEVERK